MRILKDQIESLRYINHLWPVVILRVYISLFFFRAYNAKISNGYLTQPKLSALIDENLYANHPPSWIESFFVNVVQADWSFYASLITNIEWLLGFLFLVGFLNRPAALFSLFYIYILSFTLGAFEQGQMYPHLAILTTLAVFGSGRVGGVDYFFYKRQRGLIW